MSMYASLTSAVTYIGLPATAYQENIALIAVSFASVAVTPFILKLFYPFYHRHQVTTSYQFIQKRFGNNAQRSVSTLFVLSRLGWLGTVVYAPALALAAATGFSLTTCILLMGLIATLYTTLGGMAAVVWTDVLQFIILVGGAIWIALSLVHQIDGGAITILSHAASTGRLDILDWPPSLFSLSLPIVAISFFFQLMQEYGTDQITVQRMMATGSQRKTFKAILFNAGTDLVVISTLLFIGLGLLSFYHLNPLPADIAPDSLMPYYIIHQLPNGVNGLLITAIFAAAMSSMDSGINAVATVLLNDYKKPKNQIVTKARFITILLGILATGIAFYVSSIGGLIKAFYSFMGLFSAPILALFPNRSAQSPDGISSLVNRACSLASFYTVAATWARRALGVVFSQLLYCRLCRQRHRQLFFNYELNGVTPFLRMIFPYLAVVPVITHEKAFSARS